VGGRRGGEACETPREGGRSGARYG